MTVGRSDGRTGGPAVLLTIALLLAAGSSLRAQDTIQVIRPESKTPDSTRAALPDVVRDEAMAAYNDSLTTRIVGPFYLPPRTQLIGPVAVFRGALRVGGELIGRVTVINGDLIIDPGGSIRGEVLVVGGRIVVRPGGTHQGPPPRIYPGVAQLVRTSAGKLIVRPPARTLSDIATARKTIHAGGLGTTLSAETGRTYNRVEGLPIAIGPTVVREGPSKLDARLDLRGLLWTAPDRTGRRADFGYTSRLEFRFGTARRLTVGAQAYRQVLPTEEQPLSRTEAGWAAFLLQRDYRDYYQAEGVGGYASYRLGHGLILNGSLRRDAEQSVPAADPISVFRNADWRPNPLVDDGHFLSWRLGLDFDTRNERENPSSGWLVRGYWERSTSNDAAPVSLPSEVREPIPPGPYASSRLYLDARRYSRFSPSIRTSARLLVSGWIGGDPLPIQRRFSLGGPDLLPGYPFRNQNCVPASLTDPAHSALCDRLIALQLEMRTRTHLGLPIPVADPYLTGLQRLFAIREPDIVIFGDAGKAWVTGEGPGRVPNNKIPVLREWDYDIGFGVDFGGLAFYLAQPLNHGLPLTFTTRLQRRF